jgi:hypothetical protein
VLYVDAHIQFGEHVRHSAWTLVHVGNDSEHASRITDTPGRYWLKRATEAIQLPALSRRESA